ncbi:MAG: hypothetical protein V4819_26065 [Verrucomicrobiota bacterium]
MMKATKLITLAALIGTCSFAAAQEGAPPPPPAQGERPERPQRQVPPDVLKKFDKDGDGKLSQEEGKAAREAMQAERIKKYDKDGDGKLSDEERKTMQADNEAKRKALLEKYDADKNGKLDPAEIKTATDAGEEIPMGGRGGRGPGGPGGQRGGGKPADAPPAGE